MKFLSFALLLLLNFNLLAASKKGVKVFVELSPAGSFEIMGKIKGRVTLSKGVYKAKGLITKISTFKTGLDLRDEHTIKKLKTFKGETYATIEVVEATGKKGKGTATIKIRNVKKSKIPFTFKEMGKYIKATFKLSLKDFKFTGIKHFGVGVKDSIKVEAIIPLKKK